MKPYLNDNYSTRLNSLVINTPYKFDSYTTAPKISKLLSFPFGVRVDVESLINLLLRGFFSSALLMLVSSIFLVGICLPIQGQNKELITSTKRLTNKKFELLFNLQEATNYNKLFLKAKSFSMKDSDEVLHINGKPNSEISKEFIIYRKYPYMEFSGF